MFRQQVARALDLDSEAIDWTATVSAAESSLAERTEPANVVVVSPAVKEVDAFGLAEFVSKSSPASAVLLVRDHTANGILPAAMRAGIREVVDLSRGGEDLQEALERATNWSQSLLAVQGTGPVTAQEYGKVFSVFSSKGGTGKTFLATGLAQSLARDTQKDVALLDLELTMSDSLSYFGKEPSRALQDLLSIGEESDRTQILEHGVQVDEHLWVYASPPDPAGLEAVSSESLGKVISSLRQNFAYVLIDGTATYSDAVLAAFDLSETVALIAGLDVVGVRHLSLALQTFISLGFPTDRFRFVLNRADSKVGLSVETVERIMKLKVDGMIPSSRLVPTALNQGRTVVEQYPNADVTKAIGTLARKLAAVYETGPAKRRLFRKA
jgi:pilus assembly protein CpaE